MVIILLYTSALTLFSRDSLKKQFTDWFIHLVNRVSHVLGRLVKKLTHYGKGSSVVSVLSLKEQRITWPLRTFPS